MESPRLLGLLIAKEARSVHRQQKTKAGFSFGCCGGFKAGVAGHSFDPAREGSEASAFGMHQADAGPTHPIAFCVEFASQEQDALLRSTRRQTHRAGDYESANVWKQDPACGSQAIPLRVLQWRVFQNLHAGKSRQASRCRQFRHLFVWIDLPGGGGETGGGSHANGSARE